ncbi:hypothetical protein OPV22_016251 [Ensete ventricosum]|uniref:F-box protein At3g26010-like beta-propeller domain-containing protein n=1 Tax=Ensete ventricosum TaxID=4639 RepID=A0AAV8QPZ5_ENSVE|nr:hypothetical protein OPV22_016251 [Ensete ventricosum]
MQKLSCHGSPVSFGLVYKRQGGFFLFPIDIPGELNSCMPDSFFPTLPDGTIYNNVLALVGHLLLLVLLMKSDSRIYYVWNLVTKVGHTIPTIRDSRCLGLALHASTTAAAGYKLVNLVLGRWEDSEEYLFQVYSSATGRWMVSDHRLIIRDTLAFHGQIHPSLSSRRVIYWDRSPYLLWFDVEKDVAGHTPLPTMDEGGGVRVQKLGVTYDEGILTVTRLLTDRAITIWMMAKEGGWERKHQLLHNIPMEIFGDVYIASMNQIDLLSFSGGDRLYLHIRFDNTLRLCCYNITTGEMTKIIQLGGVLQVSCPSMFLNHNSMVRSN